MHNDRKARSIMSFPYLKNADIEMPDADSKCWYMDSNLVEDHVIEECAQAHLSPDEIATGLEKHSVSAKIAFWCSRLTLRHSLSQYTNNLRAPGEWDLVKLKTGRVVLNNDNSAGDHLEFSITHTKGIIMCAITTGKSIGIDVELANRRINPAAFNPRTYSANELNILRMSSTVKRRNLALKLWTLKEATAKTLGTGLSEDFSEIDFHVSSTGEISLNSVGIKHTKGHWKMRQNLFQSRYYLAVVTR